MEVSDHGCTVAALSVNQSDFEIVSVDCYSHSQADKNLAPAKLLSLQALDGFAFVHSYSDQFSSINRHCPILFYAWLVLSLLFVGASGLGSMNTIAVSYNLSGGVLVCAILQGSIQRIQCWSSVDESVSVVSPSETSFFGITGGEGFLCAIREDTGRPFCWNMDSLGSSKRLKNELFSLVVAGESQVCALPTSSTNGTIGSLATCWRNDTIVAGVPQQQSFSSLVSGASFVCGLKANDSTVQCWGSYDSSRLPNTTFRSIQAGAYHACGLTEAWNTQCWGDNTHNQLQAPSNSSQFLALALGERHSCGIDALNRTVECWGDSNANRTAAPRGITFSTIAAGDSFTCGMVNTNFSILCWGGQFGAGRALPLNLSVPSFCSATDCDSGSFQPQSNVSGGICASSQHVCLPCRISCEYPFVQTSPCGVRQDITCSLESPVPDASPLSPAPLAFPIAPSPAVVTRYVSRLSGGLIALTVLGAVGILCGVLAVVWCIWAKFYGPVGFSWDGGGQGRVHHSIAPGTINRAPSVRSIRRQRSSTSSVRSRSDIAGGRAQAFTIDEMATATNGFSDEYKIGSGSFGVVYRGMLPDGREVAIKRGDKEAVASERKVAEKENAFESELQLLSRVHHKHLVSLVGYCDDEDERMLVYDYMPNGTLHDHLHGRGGSEAAAALLWPMRIKIALEAARGVEYLHTYAVPPIIHRDIKTSNILLDGGWSARVSDFGLSTRGPAENSHLSLMAVGTLGYMDPEYYRLQHLTIKSDVYSFGVVLLEILTGERAIHKESQGPINIVDFAVPKIDNNELASVLDQRPPPPRRDEFSALEIIGQLAARCVQLEGKERPSMSEIVVLLEEAMAYGSNGRSRSQSAAIAAAVDSNGSAR